MNIERYIAVYLERIYEYKEVRAQQEAFLEKLKDGFAMQIMDVANCKLIDYHSFMDMLHGEWHFKDAYEYFTNLVAEYEILFYERTRTLL